MGQTSSGAFDGSGTGVFPGGGQMRTITAVFDFDVQGGTIGTYAVATIPKGSQIIGGNMVVNTQFTGTGTLGVNVESTSDIVTAAAVAGAPWSTTGVKAINVVIETESGWVTTTADRNVIFAITLNTVTAGKATLTLFIIRPQ